MAIITREAFLERLDNDWRDLIERFEALSRQDQENYLARQGYARLADLLAHVIAWWQDGVVEIEKMRADPALPLKGYDVDVFNAEALKRFGDSSPEEVIQTYRSQQRVMVELVKGLSNAELAQQNINKRLYYEIIQHWTEHELILNHSGCYYARPGRA